MLSRALDLLYITLVLMMFAGLFMLMPHTAKADTTETLYCRSLSGHVKYTYQRLPAADDRDAPAGTPLSTASWLRGGRVVGRSIERAGSAASVSGHYGVFSSPILAIERESFSIRATLFRPDGSRPETVDLECVRTASP